MVINAKVKTLTQPPSIWAPSPLERAGRDVHLEIFAFVTPEDVIQLWHSSNILKKTLRGRHALWVWDRVRQAAGMGPPDERRRPDHEELAVLEYALIERCQVCGSRDAVRQWCWATRMCYRCLPPRVTTRREFLRINGNLFRSMPDAIRTMAWANPAHVAGLEATSLASKSLDVGDGAEDPNDVIIRHWASSAVAAVHHVKQVKGNSLPKLIEEDVTGLIRGDSWWARERLNSIRNAQEFNPWEVKRQGQKRADRITSMLLGMGDLKLALEDIPNFDQPRWRPLVYRGTELTAEDFSNIKGPILKAAKRHRDNRLRSVLRDHTPPTPSSVANPGYRGPSDITGIFVGGLPADLFLEICTNLDLATASALERTSKEVRSLLRSPQANSVWRTIRLSLGLTAMFPHWPERAFLAFALGRTCTSCGEAEGLNMPRIASIICGDCFERCLTHSNAPTYRNIKHLLSSMVRPLAGPYIDAGWIRHVKGCHKLVMTDYAGAMLNWARSLPKAVKKAVPDETLAQHVMESTRPFLDTANQCENWQSSRDPDKSFLVQRREAWIIHRLRDQHGLDVPTDVLQSVEWKAVVTRDYPISLKEWRSVGPKVVQMLR